MITAMQVTMKNTFPYSSKGCIASSVNSSADTQWLWIRVWWLVMVVLPTFGGSAMLYSATKVPDWYMFRLKVPGYESKIAFGILMLIFAPLNAFSRFSIYTADAHGGRGVHYFWIFWKYPAVQSNDVDEEAGCCKCWPWCPTLSQPYHGFRDCCCAECSWVCTSFDLANGHEQIEMGEVAVSTTTDTSALSAKRKQHTEMLEERANARLLVTAKSEGDIGKLRMAQLKSILKQNYVEHDSCVEKQELVELVIELWQTAGGGAARGDAVIHNQPAQHPNKVRTSHPQSPYSTEEIYAEIEEEIYACAGDEIQALNAQASAGGRSSMATRLDERLKQVADEVTAKLASVGKSATRADVERKLKAIAPKEVPGSLILAMALEDSERANAELQRKIAELQATRSLPSVPIDRDASARRAGHGGGTVYATYASSSTRADEGDDYEMPDEGDDYEMPASANAEDDAYEVSMNAEDDIYGIDSDSSIVDF